MRILVLTAVLALAGSIATAQTGPAEPKNYSTDPWHLNVPKPVANPVTSVTEKQIVADTIAYFNGCLK